MLLDALRILPPLLMLALAFLLPALEASTMLGVIFPGEVAILVAGASAHAGTLMLWTVIVAGTSGAILGDAVGFALGRRYGTPLLRKLPSRLIKPEGVQTARELLRRYGPAAVLMGRFVALLRALVPGLAGMSDLSWRAFLPYNMLGGAIWATGVAVLGYLTAASLEVLEWELGLVSEILLAGVVLAVLLVCWRRRARRQPDTGKS
ncbi:MAG TPA: DedA family protein [Pseudonocardiaceae bacterium]|nr:DedA family protein [Pseudonocardiaceae bacterium]